MAEIDPTVQQINDLYSQQLAQQKAQLEAQRNKAVLEEQQKAALIAPKYTASKQQVNVQSQLGAKNFAEYLAQRGMTNFGISGQAELSRQNALANQIQGYNTSQAAEELASNQNISGYNTLYNTELTNAQNIVAASKAEALLNYAEQLRQEKAKVEEQKRQEQLAAEQDALEWNRTVAERKRQEQLAEAQAIAAWNRQIEEQKRQEKLAQLVTATKSAKTSSGTKSSSGSSSNILTTTNKNTTKKETTKKVMSYDQILSDAKNIYKTKGSATVNSYLGNLITAGQLSDSELKKIVNEIDKMAKQSTTKATAKKATTKKTTSNNMLNILLDVAKNLTTIAKPKKSSSKVGGGGGGF